MVGGPTTSTQGTATPDAVTVNAAASVALDASGFVTTTFHAPAALPRRSSVALTAAPDDWVEASVPITSGCPLRVSFTPAPGWTSAPETSTVTDPALPPRLGEIDESEIAEANVAATL